MYSGFRVAKSSRHLGAGPPARILNGVRISRDTSSLRLLRQSHLAGFQYSASGQFQREGIGRKIDLLAALVIGDGNSAQTAAGEMQHDRQMWVSEREYRTASVEFRGIGSH